MGEKYKNILDLPMPSSTPMSSSAMSSTSKQKHAKKLRLSNHVFLEFFENLSQSQKVVTILQVTATFKLIIYKIFDMIWVIIHVLSTNGVSYVPKVNSSKAIVITLTLINKTNKPKMKCYTPMRRTVYSIMAVCISVIL